MKTIILSALLLAAPVASPITKEKGTYIVDTTTLAADVMGYNGTTPLKVHIRKGKVVKIEYLPNEETPRYWRMAAEHLLHSWDNMTVDEALAAKVDGRTGATYSSDAIKENVRRGLERFKAMKN